MTNMEGPRIPGSLAEVSKLAPLVMAGTGLLTILQFGALDGNSLSSLPLVFGAFVVPTIGTTLVSRYLAKQERGKAVIALLGWFGAHAALAGLVGAASSGNDASGLALFAAMFVSGITLVLAAPALIATAVYGGRRDLEAGDAYLAFAGVWYLGLQLLAYSFMREASGMQWLVLVPGMLAGAAAVVLSVVRMVRRRSFSLRAARGELDGWRVRAMKDGDELGALPPLFGSPLHATAVLERVENGFTAYRSALVGMPIARVGGEAARLAEQDLSA